MGDKKQFEKPKLVPLNPESSDLPEEDLSRVTGGDESGQSFDQGNNALLIGSSGA